MARKPVPGLPDVFARPGGAPARGTSIEDLPRTTADLTWPGRPRSEADAGTIALESSRPESGRPESGTAESGTAESGTAESGTAELGTAESGTAELGTAELGTAALGAHESGVAASGAAKVATPEWPAIERGASAQDTIEAAVAAVATPTAAQPFVAEPVTPPSAVPPPESALAYGARVPPTDHPAIGPATQMPDVAGRRGGPGGVPVVVWVVLLISLTAPLWENTILSTLGVRSPAEIAAARDTAAVARDEARLALLEQRLTITVAQLDAMRAGVSQATQHATDAATQARTIALLQLAEALRGPTPFAAELAVLRGSGGDAGPLQPMLNQLAPYATTGAPTQDQLLRELRTLNDSVAHTVRQANPGSWMDIINWTGINGTQPPPRMDPSLRAIQQGLARLSVGDIPGAIEQASQVDDAYQADVSDWIMEAKARLAANAMLRQIDTVIARASGAK